MKAFRIFGLVLLALLLGVTSFEFGTTNHPVTISLVSKAEAVVGRPLTPVSYAGVARRTARRCRAGVYYC
jgi:hypothetical protein